MHGKPLDRAVTSIQTSLDTTYDRFRSEVHVFASKRSVARFTRVGVVLLGIANLLSIVTFSAPGWGWTSEIAGIIKVAGKYNGLYGVWYVCWTDIDEGYLGMCNSWAQLDDSNVPSWIGGFQAVSVLVLLSGLASFSLLMAYICIPAANKNPTILLTYAGVTLLTAALTLAQWLTFLISFLRDAFFCCKPELVRQITAYRLSYCFIISCVCTGLYLLIFILAVMEWASLRNQYRKLTSSADASDEKSQSKH